QARQRAPPDARRRRTLQRGAHRLGAGAGRRCAGACPPAPERRALRAAHLDRRHGHRRRPVHPRLDPDPPPRGRGRAGELTLAMATLQTLPEVTTILPAGTSAGVTPLAMRTFFYAVFKHTRLVVGTFLLIFLAAAVTAVVRPTIWMASTTVLVKLGETAQLAPSEAPSRSYYLPMTPEVVKTEADIVKSYDVIRRAVEQLGVQPEPGTTMDEMVTKMQLVLTVTPSPGANTLQISYIGRDPQRAARMVNRITDVYIDHHNNVYRTQGMHSLYAEQLRILKAQMKAAQRRFRAHLQREHVIDVDQEILLLNQASTLQDRQLREHRLKMVGVQQQLNQLRVEIARSPVLMPYGKEYHANPTRQVFENQLAGLEIERYKVLQAYLP